MQQRGEARLSDQRGEAQRSARLRHQTVTSIGIGKRERERWKVETGSGEEIEGYRIEERGLVASSMLLGKKKLGKK